MDYNKVEDDVNTEVDSKLKKIMQELLGVFGQSLREENQLDLKGNLSRIDEMVRLAEENKLSLTELESLAEPLENGSYLLKSTLGYDVPDHQFEDRVILLECLLKHGISIHQEKARGTPLVWVTNRLASSKNTTSARWVKYLIKEHGLDPQRRVLRTPLVHYAIIQNNLAVLKALSECGVDLFKKENGVQSPLDIVMDAEIKSYLLGLESALKDKRELQEVLLQNEAGSARPEVMRPETLKGPRL